MQNSINANTQVGDLDANYDGKLSAQELSSACGIPLADAQECIAQYDVDGDGSLDVDEFNDLKTQILAQQRANLTNNLNATQQHDGIDADGDGQVNAAELAAACNISEQEAQNIIYQYDEDGDGTLSLAEFNDLKTQILSQQREAAASANLGAQTYHDDVDGDGDGKLSAAELASACNITQQEAQNLIYQYDADGDGSLDAAEFQNLKEQIMAQQRQNMTNKLGANDDVQKIDGDGDGRLSAAELAKACNVSEQEARNIIAQYDVDGDGLLDAEEFEQLKQQVLQQQREQLAKGLGGQGYNALDDNKDGLVSAQELAAATGLSLNEAELAIQQFDTNKSGYLDAQEFEKLKESIRGDQREKERVKQIQEERRKREETQKQQYKENGVAGDDVQEFKHKWKFGMNFDPKMECVVLYVSDEVSNKNWGISLKKADFGGPIRSEYRKLGAVIGDGQIKYDYPKYGGPLGVMIEGKGGETYNYKFPEQM